MLLIIYKSIVYGLNSTNEFMISQSLAILNTYTLSSVVYILTTFKL